ncbi:uncharacterized protein K489DRAFT_30790 [Dissoconium aciculare CBS 342.82]|uniref:Uncharacterized protein n=1 Tax=Dissoconium aciculare CBS 342.82 TaxID=1314786 RepID=A0A6J3MLK2_9PEZI|nr:uncharacterized protein K489DRAFT_30790 [Dissoconium aciculare CBS 342.82]KAF1827872.1 hypothetical protein K489DRAFT_30790 [Dissoconium aciculare CBS 342.82]
MSVYLKVWPTTVIGSLRFTYDLLFCTASPDRRFYRWPEMHKDAFDCNPTERNPDFESPDSHDPCRAYPPPNRKCDVFRFRLRMATVSTWVQAQQPMASQASTYDAEAVFTGMPVGKAMPPPRLSVSTRSGVATRRKAKGGRDSGRTSILRARTVPGHSVFRCQLFKQGRYVQSRRADGDGILIMLASDGRGTFTSENSAGR